MNPIEDLIYLTAPVTEKNDILKMIYGKQIHVKKRILEAILEITFKKHLHDLYWQSTKVVAIILYCVSIIYHMQKFG